MDPYRTLGVDRGCTREDVKAAFRAKVRLAHPDLGGDELTFITYCAAYKQLLKEVPPGLTTSKEARAEASTRKPPRPARAQKPGQGAAFVRGRKPRPPAPADSSWNADLVLPADVGRDGEAAPPPDPRWQADLILHDDAPADNRPPQPPDPTFQPDVVLLDGLAARAFGDGAGAPISTPEQYRSLYERLAAKSTDGNRMDWQNPWIRTIGLLILAALIAGNIWLCWFAWNDEPAPATQAPASRGGLAR